MRGITSISLKAIFDKTARHPGVRAGLLSDRSLTRKAYLNALASALEYGARLVVGFLITPVLLAGLGSFFFGSWQILNRLVGYISPASGRPSQALKWTLANQQASADYDQKRRLVGSTIAVWLLFLPLMAALGAALVWSAPYWLKAPPEAFPFLRIATGLLVANLAMTSLAEIPQSVLEGENLGYKRIGLTLVLIFAGGGLIWLALSMGLGLGGVAAAALITTLLTGLAFLKVVRGCAPWFGVAWPSPAAARRFLGLSWWFLGWNLVMNLMLSGDVVLLGLIESPAAVTAYALSKYAPETAVGLVAIMVFGSAPGLGGIIGSGNLGKAARVRSEMMALTWLIVVVLGTTILLWNRSFVTLWVGSEQYVGTMPALAITLLVTQFALIRNDANVIDLTLRLNRKVLMGLLSVALSLAAAALLVGPGQLGITGLCLGIMAGRLVLSLGYPLMVGRFLAIRPAALARGTLRPALATALLFGLAAWLDATWSRGGGAGASAWLLLAVSGTVTAALALLFAFYAGLTRGQRASIIQRAQQVLSPPA